MRPLWAQRIEKLLKPSGELITLMFPVSNHTISILLYVSDETLKTIDVFWQMDERSGGPPYKVSVSE